MKRLTLISLSIVVAETARSNAQAAIDLEMLRAHGESRAAEEWLAANCD